MKPSPSHDDPAAAGDARLGPGDDGDAVGPRPTDGPGRYGDDPSGGLLAEVARSGAREWQRDMAAWEGEAEQLRHKRRSLADLLWEAMQRGDRVTVTVAGVVFSGKLTVVRGDLAVLGGLDTTAALNLGAVDVVSMERNGDGVVGDRTHGSLRSYLGMLEVEQTQVRMVGSGFDVAGRVTAVAVDHVLLAAAAGVDVAIPITTLGAAVTTAVQEEPSPATGRT